MKRITVAVLTVTACSSLACGFLKSATGGSSDTAAPQPVEVGPVTVGQKVQSKPAKGISSLIHMGTSSDPAPPAPGVTYAQCAQILDGGPVKGPACITDTIECGQTIVGHTRGGTNNFDTRWYERNFCTPGTTQHDSGDERVYRFRFPSDGKWRAWFTLDTPCADLDVFAIQYSGSGCPGPSDNVNECDANVKGGATQERAEAVSDGSWQDWLVVVEGKGDAEGAFSLSAQCREGLQ